MKDNYLVVKYSVGILVISVLTLLVQGLVFLLSIPLSFVCTLVSIVVISLLGFYILPKIILKKENSSLKVSLLLNQIFVISLICMLLSTIYIVFRFHILFNVQDGLLMLQNMGSEYISPAIMQRMGNNAIQLALVNNAKYITSALIISTVYIAFLVFILERYWINNVLQIEKNNRIKLFKNCKSSIVLVIVILILEVVSLFGLTVYVLESETNTLVVQVEDEITHAKRTQIENQLNQITEIIKYEYKSSSSSFDEMKNRFNNMDIFNTIDSEVFPSTYEIQIYAKDRDKVIQKLKMINGIRLK